MSESVAQNLEAEAAEEQVSIEVIQNLGDQALKIVPTEEIVTGESVEAFEPAPEGWLTNNRLAKQLDWSHIAVKKVAGAVLVENPEMSKVYIDTTGKKSSHYHPDLVDHISKKLAAIGDTPEGWETIYSLSKRFEVSDLTVKRMLNKFAQEGFGDLIHAKRTFRSGGSKRKLAEHYPPEVVDLIAERLHAFEPAPAGWMTTAGLAKDLGVDNETVSRIARRAVQADSGLAQEYRDSIGRPREHFHPDLVERVKSEIQTQQPAPEGWLTNRQLADNLSVAFATTKTIVESLTEEHPEWAGLFKSSTGMLRTHYHPELVDIVSTSINGQKDAPNGWITRTALGTSLGVDFDYVKKLAEGLRADFSDSFAFFKDGIGHLREHYAPELVAQLTNIIERRKAESLAASERTLEMQRLETGIKDFVSDVKNGESIQAQDFRNLVELFGAEEVVDIVYSFHPEYKRISLPLVKSILADYLGEFLVIRGDLQLDKLAGAVDLLSNQNLKDRLVEVVKLDCLKRFNQVQSEGGIQDQFEFLSDYIDSLQTETSDYATPELTEVFDVVEQYYQALFTNIHLPVNVREEVKAGRAFPDLNQRINIEEIRTKHKMLLADEMGVGKSASAILAKEALGVETALVVVPSNVVDVWLGYLSDQVSEDGEAVGYFKTGEAPNVLVVEDIKNLSDADIQSYDYVILSQERLTNDYVTALEATSFDMLVVDEVQKLKNLVAGKRAENLLRLAAKVESDDQYLALLSGTPVPNKVSDVAMILRLLYPEQFAGIANNELTSQILRGDLLDIRSLLVPRMQMKSLAESVGMPDLQEQLHTSTLSEREQAVYDVLLDEDEFTATEKLQMLRKFVLNPRLFDTSPDTIGTKAQDVGNQLHTSFTSKDKVVLFVNSYIEGVIRGRDTILQDLNVPEGVVVKTIDGHAERKQRLAIQRQLQALGQKMLLLVSGQTADVGVDFSSADEVMFYNEPWTEYDKLQQRGRVYRPGLAQDLVSRSFVTDGTIEEGIHRYIKSKYEAVEKLLRGIPISQLERELLSHDEKKGDPQLEHNPDIAKFYLSRVERMLRFFSFGKQSGEQSFARFNARYGKEYADTYAIMGSRSYQANVNRLAGTVIDRLVKARKQRPSDIRILDVASGPEVLKRHIDEKYQAQIYSIDFNKHHFNGNGKQAVGSFLRLPVADKVIDYANVALSLHYTSFVPTRQDYERLELIRELNRVLTIGGRVVISLTNSLDIKNLSTFYGVINKLGFKVVEEFSGDVKAGTGVRTRLTTLEKTGDCSSTLEAEIKHVGPASLQGLKLKKTGIKLKDARKIATSFVVDDKRTIRANINRYDKEVLAEEKNILTEMDKLKNKYGSVEAIPEAEIKQRGFARAFNSRHYILFKYLSGGNGAVICR